MDGRAPTLGLLSDLGVEAWPDHLLTPVTTRRDEVWRRGDAAGGEGGWGRMIGRRRKGGRAAGRIKAEKTTAWMLCGPG